MNINFEVLKKTNIENRKDYKTAFRTALELQSFLNRIDTQNKIIATHKVYAKSTEIQAIVLDKLLELGFQAEKKGLFSQYQCSALRPDYFKEIAAGKGIILEVERGKTTANNMDLLDLWKCHICNEANFLFLVVQSLVKILKGGSSRTFDTVP